MENIVKLTETSEHNVLRMMHGLPSFKKLVSAEIISANQAEREIFGKQSEISIYPSSGTVIRKEVNRKGAVLTMETYIYCRSNSEARQIVLNILDAQTKIPS
jgi:hypothetical protein